MLINQKPLETLSPKEERLKQFLGEQPEFVEKTLN